MVCKCICIFVVQSLFLFSVFTLALLLIPNLPPYASFQESYRVPTSKPLEGKLAINERLENVELWHNGEILHPEAFAAYNDEIYTGLSGGDIVKLTGQHITPIVKTGKPCRGLFEERICGRPLGLQFDKNGALYVADAYYGLLKVDVKTGRKQVIVSPDTKINGKEPKIFNSLALASNSDIYWTDTSTDFYLKDAVIASLADSSGRLIHYNAKTKQNKVLIDKLRFANGVVLSEDESEVLVADMLHMRIVRYYLKGPKVGTHEVFIDSLPGFPDNIKGDGKGGYLIPLLIPADPDHPQMLTVFNEFPLVRKFLARLMGVTQMIFEMIDRAYPNDYSLRAIHFIGHFTGILISKHRATIINVSKSGKILDSIHTTTKPISVSEAFIHKDTLYLGSPFDEYIGRIKLSEVGWAHLAQVQPRKLAEQAKPSPAPVKQETTTSKPATQPTVPPTQKQTPPPTKPTTTPPQKETTTPPPKQTTSVPPKQATTTTPPPTQKQTPSPTPKQAPPKPQTTTTPPPPVQKHTATPGKEAQKQTVPPAQQQTPPVKQVPPQQKQATPQNQQKQVTPQTQQSTTPPVQKQTPPPAQQQTSPPVPKQSSPSKQTPPPSVQKQSPPPKQTPPPQQQPSTTPPVQKQSPPKQAPPQQQQHSTTPPPVQKQSPPPKQTPPPQKQQHTPPPQAKQPSPPPPTQSPPVKETSQPKPATTKEPTKTVPVRETVKTR